MAKPTSLPTHALEAVPDSVLEHLQSLPPQTTPRDYEFPPTSVAIPDQAPPLPDQTVGHVPVWLL
jgi:hypothetical protein